MYIFASNYVNFNIIYTNLYKLLLQIKEHDHLPAYICQNCKRQLIEFYEFRKKCLATDSLHRDRVNISFLCDTYYSTNNNPSKEEVLLETIKVECTEQVYDDCFAEPLQNDKNTMENVKGNGNILKSEGE